MARRRKSLGYTPEVSAARADHFVDRAEENFKRSARAFTEGFCRKGLKHLLDGESELGAAREAARGVGSSKMQKVSRLSKAALNRFVEECGVALKRGR